MVTNPDTLLLICMRIWQLTWFDMFVRHCSLLKGWSRKPKCKRDIAIMAGAGDLTKVLCLTSSCFSTLSTWKLFYGQVFIFNPTRHHIWGGGWVQTSNNTSKSSILILVPTTGMGEDSLLCVWSSTGFQIPYYSHSIVWGKNRHWIKQSWCSENIETTAYFRLNYHTHQNIIVIRCYCYCRTLPGKTRPR